MGKLVQLEVYNFKSYRDKHVLLFGDSYFTSVIGPNGSGKSNSMDAISFVLGVKSSHLRSTNLRDLIYRGRVLRTSKINADGTATEPNGESHPNGSTTGQRNDPTSAYVEAVFEDDAEQVHRWRRTITSAGQSEYRINGRSVTSKAYNDALEEQSILVKARNFLVFQGDVEQVATQNSRELTRLVEQISGSLDKKAEYERLKEESEAATENNAQHLTQRRQINAEIRTYTEQKAEFDEFEKKVAERDQAVVTHALWKLFQYQQTMGRARDNISSHQEELKEHKRSVEKYERKLDEARQAQAKASREVTKVDRHLKSKEAEIDAAVNNLDPIKEKIKVTDDHLHQYRNRIASLTKERDEKQQQVEKHGNELATVQRAQQKWEEEFRVAAQQQGRELSNQDIQEYNRLRGEVTKQTHTDQIQADRLRREVDTDREHATNLQQNVATHEAAIEKLSANLSALQERQHTLKTKNDELQASRTAKQQTLDKLKSDRRQIEREQREKDQMLQETLGQLQRAESGRRETRKQTKSREAVTQMKRIFGDRVHGRYRDLFRPKQKKYQRAVNEVIGWQLDALIVDTDQVARECIQYLKDNKIGTMNIIPLDTLQIKAIDSSLKGMHTGMRLAIDCIDWESKNLDRAMAAACGNAIICDTIEIAQALRFPPGGKGRIEAKAVTLDGTVIHKHNTVQGGRLEQDGKDPQWDDQVIEALNAKVEKLREELSALPKASQTHKEESDLEVEVNDHTYQISQAQEELKALGRNIEGVQTSLQHHKSQLRGAQPNYQKQVQRLQNREEELKSYQDAVDQVADQIFAAFCTRLGYSSIRDYEAQQGTVQQEAAEKRLEFRTQEKRQQSFLKFFEKQLEDHNERLQALEKSVERDQALIQGFKSQQEDLQSSIDELRAELESSQENKSKMEARLTERSAIVKEARRTLDQRNEKVKKVMKEVEDQEIKIKTCAANRYNVFKQCRVDEVKIPLTSKSRPLTTLPMNEIGHAETDATDMDLDEESDSTQIHQPEVDDYGIEIDFDMLDEELRNEMTEMLEIDNEEEEKAHSTASALLKEAESKLTDRITSLDTEISKSTPNMRAGERLASTEAKLRDVDNHFTEARKRAAAAKKAFEDIKQKRLELFMKAFDHISENIGGTYKDLTKSSQFPLGGQAYLDMEDSTEPYLAGLKYHAMPPLKRFRDMEHLSGGEKTIAALALLFAIHSYQPSPFFVLDEVDAALDNVNVSRVAKYVKEHASPGMQFIVISLKAGFFQESESLVGVMRDQSKMSSRVVSLDLRKYQPS